MNKIKFMLFFSFCSLFLATYLSIYAYKQASVYKSFACDPDGGDCPETYQKVYNEAKKAGDDRQTAIDKAAAAFGPRDYTMAPDTGQNVDVLTYDKAVRDLSTIGAKHDPSKNAQYNADKNTINSIEKKYGLDKENKSAAADMKIAQTLQKDVNIKTDPSNPALQQARQSCIDSTVGAKDCVCQFDSQGAIVCVAKT